MKERKLTGNEMFELVKEECERILGKVEGKGKKRRKGVLFRGQVYGEYICYEFGNEDKNGKYVMI